MQNQETTTKPTRLLKLERKHTITTTTTVVGGGSGGKFIPDDNFTNELDINYIYLMYGIPKSLIDLFYEIIHLTNHKTFSIVVSIPKKFPENLC